MHEIILLILHTSNLGVQGRPLVESSWNEIIKNTIEDANAASRSVFDALKDKVRDIGLRYYPDENVFPLSMSFLRKTLFLLTTILEFLIAKLEKESYEFSIKGMASERGWLLKTLVGIKVPYNAIFSVLHDLFETKVCAYQ